MGGGWEVIVLCERRHAESIRQPAYHRTSVPERRGRRCRRNEERRREKVKEMAGMERRSRLWKGFRGESPSLTVQHSNSNSNNFELCVPAQTKQRTNCLRHSASQWTS
ncbi:hypothetical protein ALC53_01014 [Atta colombica]|uniref:Uncharacterized protein n=1 Tax=Atta colombica TaxID=520822 RepID=A0A195BX69_9HYME|nr:hypothetical protein ALC53_01014 [Atta colombica]